MGYRRDQTKKNKKKKKKKNGKPTSTRSRY